MAVKHLLILCCRFEVIGHHLSHADLDIFEVLRSFVLGWLGWALTVLNDVRLAEAAVTSAALKDVFDTGFHLHRVLCHF